jgi:hypothetical protein
MIIRASRRSALIVAAGLFVYLAGPLQAAPGDDTASASPKSENAAGAPVALNKFAKPRHSKKFVQRKSGKAALKSSNAGKPNDVPDDSGNGATAIPPSIANANAQLATAVAPADSARAMSAKANTILLAAADNPAATPSAAETEVVAPDQFNDLDRALQQAKPAAMTLASAEAPPAAAAPVVAASKEDSTWDQTSLIGKIFIAFGALLTMASAARMFMA